MIVPMPMMIPMSDGEDNGVEYEYPFITELVFCISVAATVIGIIICFVGVICDILEIHTKWNIGYNCGKYGFTSLLIGLMLLVVSYILMAITGTPIKE